MTEHKLILATDLDGTFLGGSDEERRALYQALQARNDALLIFVTGRDLGFIRELVAEPGMPHPDFVIGDVGTTVVAGRDFRVVDEVQAPIARAWNNAGERVKAMLSGEPGIRLQPTPFERRVSYWYEPAELETATLDKIAAAGFDWLLSADTFLDVLPKGVAKGPTLLQLVETLNLPADRVLVAGDTLNDLSLFETGLKGVAVGNSEPRLVEQLTDKPWVYRSTGHGAAGIAEAIRHFGLD